MGIVAVLIYLGMCVFVGVVADKKGRSGFAWGAMTFILTPFVTLLGLIVLGETDEEYEDKMLHDHAKRVKFSSLDEELQQRYFNETWESFDNFIKRFKK